jgi:hypothetical protein
VVRLRDSAKSPQPALAVGCSRCSSLSLLSESLLLALLALSSSSSSSLRRRFSPAPLVDAASICLVVFLKR